MAQNIGAGTQELSPGLERLGGEAVGGRAILTPLQGAEDGLGVARRTDPEKSEVIDRQVQRVPVAWVRL
jgi:hypothetical protein